MDAVSVMVVFYFSFFHPLSAGPPTLGANAQTGLHKIGELLLQPSEKMPTRSPYERSIGSHFCAQIRVTFAAWYANLLGREVMQFGDPLGPIAVYANADQLMVTDLLSGANLRSSACRAEIGVEEHAHTNPRGM